MKRKGGLDDFKLYYERLPSEPRYTPSKTKKRRQGAKKDALDYIVYSELIIAIFNFLQSRKTVYRSANSSKRPAKIKANDRKTMSKVPQPNKKRTANSKR